MENKNIHIDKYFKERLGNFEQNPPEANWNKIAEKLGHKRKTGLALLIFRIAAGMAILVSTGIGYYLLTKPAKFANSSPISFNQPKVAPDDSLKLQRPYKSNPVTVPEKRTYRSDRLEPVRRIYKGPAVSDENTNENENQQKAKEFNTKPLQNRQTSALYKIIGTHKQYLLPVYLPSALSYSKQLPDTALTAEEATALLLASAAGAAEAVKIKKDRWTMGGEIAPLYSYRTIRSEYQQADLINNLNKNENGLVAYAGGIHVALATTQRLSVQAGVYYSRYGQEIKKIDTYSYRYSEYTSAGISNGRYISVANSTGVISSDHPEDAGYDKVVSTNVSMNVAFNSVNGLNEIAGADFTSAEDLGIKLTQYFDYLEVPLLLKYKVIDRKFDFNFSGGIVTNFLVGNTVSIVQDGDKTRFGETAEISHINYQGSFGIGFEYPIAPGFAFTAEPRFRYYINPIYQSSLNVHPYSFGFFAGINYIF